MGSQIVLSQGFRCGVPSLGLWNYFIVLYFIKCYALHPAMQFVAMLCWIMKQLLLLALACLLLCNYFLYTQGWYHNCSYLLWWRCHLFHHAIWWCLVRDEKTSASCFQILWVYSARTWRSGSRFQSDRRPALIVVNDLYDHVLHPNAPVPLNQIYKCYKYRLSLCVNATDSWLSSYPVVSS